MIMKNKLQYAASIAALIATSIGLALLTGCVTQNKQVLEKSTVFGFQAKTPGTASGTSILVQLGLVRNEYWSNPTSTNPVYVGPFSSQVYANLGLFSQTADESFATATNLLPTIAYQQPQISTAYPLPVTVVNTNPIPATVTTNTP